MDVRLKKLLPDDFLDYLNLITDEKLARDAGFLAVNDEFTGQMMFFAALKRNLTYLIQFNDVIVGSVAFETFNNSENEVIHDTLEIGYMLKNQYANKKIMTNAVGLAVKIAFLNLNCRQLIAYVEKNNVASKRVLEKNGFKMMNNVNDEKIMYKLTKNIID